MSILLGIKTSYFILQKRRKLLHHYFRVILFKKCKATMKFKFWDKLVIWKYNMWQIIINFTSPFLKKYTLSSVLSRQKPCFCLAVSLKKMFLLVSSLPSKKLYIFPSTLIKEVYLLPIPSILVVNVPRQQSSERKITS